MAEDSASDWWNFGVNVVIAIATLAAVIVALLASSRAGSAAARAEKLQADRDAALALNELEQKAGRVYAWTEGRPNTEVHGEVRSDAGVLIISNDGPNPVFEVHTVFWCYNGTSDADRLHVLAMLNPGQRFELPILISHRQVDMPVVTLRFRDSSGLWWDRNQEGHITRSQKPGEFELPVR